MDVLNHWKCLALGNCLRYFPTSSSESLGASSASPFSEVFNGIFCFNKIRQRRRLQLLEHLHPRTGQWHCQDQELNLLGYQDLDPTYCFWRRFKDRQQFWRLSFTLSTAFLAAAFARKTAATQHVSTWSASWSAIGLPICIQICIQFASHKSHLCSLHFGFGLKGLPVAGMLGCHDVMAIVRKAPRTNVVGSSLDFFSNSLSFFSCLSNWVESPGCPQHEGSEDQKTETNFVKALAQNLHSPLQELWQVCLSKHLHQARYVCFLCWILWFLFYSLYAILCKEMGCKPLSVTPVTSEEKGEIPYEVTAASNICSHGIASFRTPSILAK